MKLNERIHYAFTIQLHTNLHPLEPMLDELAAQRFCVNMNGRVHRERGFTFCGVAQVRDYPFGYKHWCVPDGEFVQSAIQFCGEGMTVDDDGHWIKLPNLREHLLSKPGLEQRFASLVAQLEPEDMCKSCDFRGLCRKDAVLGEGGR